MVLMFVSFVYSTDTVKKVTEKAVADYFASLGLGMVWILYLRFCIVLFMFSLGLETNLTEFVIWMDVAPMNPMSKC